MLFDVKSRLLRTDASAVSWLGDKFLWYFSGPWAPIWGGGFTWELCAEPVKAVVTCLWVLGQLSGVRLRDARMQLRYHPGSKRVFFDRSIRSGKSRHFSERAIRRQILISRVSISSHLEMVVSVQTPARDPYVF